MVKKSTEFPQPAQIRTRISRLVVLISVKKVLSVTQMFAAEVGTMFLVLIFIIPFPFSECHEDIVISQLLAIMYARVHCISKKRHGFGLLQLRRTSTVFPCFAR